MWLSATLSPPFRPRGQNFPNPIIIFIMFMSFMHFSISSHSPAYPFRLFTRYYGGGAKTGFLMQKGGGSTVMG
jgi:hypothetical protein